MTSVGSDATPPCVIRCDVMSDVCFILSRLEPSGERPVDEESMDSKDIIIIELCLKRQPT